MMISLLFIKLLNLFLFADFVCEFCLRILFTKIFASQTIVGGEKELSYEVLMRQIVDSICIFEL